jgi:hypothetical protein
MLRSLITVFLMANVLKSPPQPIFIVGAPRSGTTLLATMLSSHPLISCGAETHFFPYLEANYHSISKIINDSNWPQKATEFIVSMELDGHKIHDTFSVTPQEIHAYLATQHPSTKALLESLTLTKTKKFGKSFWAEKTPNHILHLTTIRKLYPEAKIVRIVRDPRDSAYSIAEKLPWASDEPLENAYLIDQWHRKSRDFFIQDLQSFTLRYEDLVAEPAVALQRLCQFLQVSFESSMLDLKVAAQHTAPAYEAWKRQVSQGLDSSRCYPWQTREIDIVTQAISRVCREIIEQFDYVPLESSLADIPALFTSYAFITAHSLEISTLLGEGKILFPCELDRLQIGDSVLYCDVPISGTNYLKSLKKFAHFLGGVCRIALKGIRIHYSYYCLEGFQGRNLWGKLAIWILMRLGSCAKLTNSKAV